jgi:glutamate-1-semialdehyde 2,1-aminomutase
MSVSQQTRRSKELLHRAEELLVGGVNSPVRAFQAVGGDPLIIGRAQGACLWDADGNEFLDYIGSWGAMILGHAHPAVVAGIAEQAARGASYGITCELEIELASLITRAVPSIERIRFVSSGTEAAMSAVRLARASTHRDLILKFEGCYHGHADGLLSRAGSGLATLGIASSPGVPEAFAHLTLNAPYNDLGAVERLFHEHGQGIAAVIVEPIAANMGIVAPEPGFLTGLREITRKHGALLILDEVITGFRLRYGAAQAVPGVEADITTLGKIIGGGLPVGAYGGRAEIMDLVAPLGPVYQAGTLSGNPLAMRAGIETLRVVAAPGFYARLNECAEQLCAGLRRAIQETAAPAVLSAAGSLVTLFFTDRPVRSYDGAKQSDAALYARFFAAMLARGVLLPPSQFEAMFLSAAHTAADVDRTIAAAREALLSVAGSS